MRTRLAAIALLFLAAHLPFLPPSLEDLDSINFAMGVRDFDVARHQPHPPGYPVFIALSKASTAVLSAAGVAAPAARGLSLWSALGGTALVFLLYAFFRALDGIPRRALWTTILVVTAPLFWFTALRPLSDTLGLAGAVGTQALTVAAMAPTVLDPVRAGRLLMAAGFAAGLVIGIRSQTFVLTLPLLALAVVWPGSRIASRVRAAAVAAVPLGALVWAVPLVVASGGLGDYLAALGSQAGEDFSGVTMLWTDRRPRVALEAAKYTFLWPWGGLAVGGVVCALAAIGALRGAWRMPRVAIILAVAFIPYVAFHLLFHEIVTVRYALPVLVPIAYLAAVALDALDRRALPVAVGLLAAVMLWIALPATAAYGRDRSPTFAALDEVERVTAANGGVEPITMHAFARRAAEWELQQLGGRVLRPRHGQEWLAAMEELRGAPAVMFIADPRRTDLALFDPQSVRLMQAYRWPFIEPPFVGGARPGPADLYRVDSPQWMAGRGWALTAEVGGVTARDRVGPHIQPSVVWIRGSETARTLVYGGRHLGAASDPAVRVSVTLNDHVVDAVETKAGFFFRRLELPPVAPPESESYVPMYVVSQPVAGGAQHVPVALEQFDLQPAGVPMLAFHDGWHEPEYNPLTARSWRWMSENAAMWIRPIGRDVTLVLEGESPLRYFDAAATVRVRVGDTVISELTLSDDFVREVVLPHAVLAAADGRVVITSDKHFAPASAGAADARRLALRIYRALVR